MNAYIKKKMENVSEAFKSFKEAYEPLDMELYNLSQEFAGETVDERTDPAAFVDFFSN